MKKEKFKISIIDFMPNYKKFEVGKYSDGSAACIGDCVEYHGEKNWFIVYRYGDILIKQIGSMAMVGLTDFKKGDFSGVDKTNIFGAGQDWLIIGYNNEPMYEKFKSIIEQKQNH